MHDRPREFGFFCSSILALLVCGCGCSSEAPPVERVDPYAVPKDFPSPPAAPVKLTLRDEIYFALRDGESFELYSLQPGIRTGEKLADYPDQFHGWPVLGKAVVKIPSWKQPLLIGSHRMLYQHGEVFAPCFNPRHGIRVISNGQPVDLVICFECSRVDIYRGDNEDDSLTIGNGQEEFDQVLRFANLKLAGKENVFLDRFNSVPDPPPAAEPASTPTDDLPPMPRPKPLPLIDDLPPTV